MHLPCNCRSPAWVVHVCSSATADAVVAMSQEALRGLETTVMERLDKLAASSLSMKNEVKACMSGLVRRGRHQFAEEFTSRRGPVMADGSARA